jgi:hypothetical protein
VARVVDNFGRLWPDRFQLCEICKQPDNCGDCNHEPLEAEQVVELGGRLSAHERIYVYTTDLLELHSESMTKLEIESANRARSESEKKLVELGVLK